MDFGEHRGRYLAVMDYVHGYDLGQLARYLSRTGQSVSGDHAAYAIYQALRGLGFAHDLTDDAGEPLGIVHRDVSPQNIMISSDGQVFLTDFGIAWVRNESSSTQTGELKGKLAYMSPEQVYGKTADHRSDLFAMGVVFYEVLTGERLFHGESEAQTVMRVAQAELPDVREARPDLPESVQAVLAKALARAPEDRFQSATDFAASVAGLMCASPDEIEPSFREMVRRTFFRDDFVEEAGSLPELTPALDATPIRLTSQEDEPAQTPETTTLRRKLSRKERRARQTRMVLLVSIGAALLVSLVAGTILWGIGRRPTAPDDEARVAMVIQDIAPTKADPLGQPRPATRDATAPPASGTATSDGGQEAPIVDLIDGHVVTQTLMGRQGELLRCFGAAGGASLKRVVIRLGIAGDGSVSQTSLEPAEAESSDTGRCLMDITKTVTFPRHRAEMLIFRVPLQVQ
jgi:hypothetical protein